MGAEEQSVTTVALAQHETEFLLEVLASAETELLTELGRTETRDYRHKLENRLNLLEAVRAKVSRRG
jgi:hypothetical protein